MAELCEGAEVDRKKLYLEEYGHRTAVTMRMCAPIANKSKTLVADAWFGSVKCAVVLKELLGTYSVMNVKGNSKLFPVSLLK